jgi:hypothetical protein
LNEQLDELAVELEHREFQEGETTICPDKGQSLETFQADVQRLRHYADEGRFEITREHQEKWSGDRNCDAVRIRMGSEGVAWRKSLQLQKSKHKDTPSD